MRALCQKILKKQNETDTDYNYLNKAYNRAEGMKIAKYIFGMILLPLETNRKKIYEYVEGFHSLLEQYEGQKDRRLLVPHYLETMDKNVYLGDN